MATKQEMKGSPAIHYEDFVPKSEWNEEPEANLLLVHLPGFTKEQIRVTYINSSKSLRITGERPLEGAAKQWSRFNKVFPVPQNCLVEKIHGNFNDNILTITLPKQTITRIPNTTSNTSNLKEPRKESPQKTQETLSDTLTEEKKDGNGKVLRPGGTQAPPMSATTVKKIDSKEGRGVLEDHKREQKDEKFTYSAGEAPSETETTTTTTAKTTQTKKVLEDSYPGHVSRVQNGIENAKTEDPLGSDQNIQRQPAFPRTEGDKARAKRATKNDVERKEKGMMDLAMNTVKKFRGLEMSEEKKLMVNVGVAALVIFALGAYVSYTFTSSSSSSSTAKARE